MQSVFCYYLQPLANWKLNKVIDLHCHSTYSDGLLSPAELLHRAANRGVKVLALTDHDETGGLTEARSAALALDVNLINGVEISVNWNDSIVHIVGLNIDPNDCDLQEGLEFIRRSRVVRAEGIAAELAKIGIENSLAGAYEYVTNKHMIGRAHFARFLCARGHAHDFKSVFDKYLAQGKPGYVAGKWATLSQAVGWITGCGGVAVIAHPGRYSMNEATMVAFIAEFKDTGGEAIEVVTPSHRQDQYSTFARYATQFGLCASIGSDYHGPVESRCDFGRLPSLPTGCTPVWDAWPGIRQ